MAVNHSNLGLAQGLLQGVERNRRIGLEDAERERRHKREDVADQRAGEKHDATMRNAKQRDQIFDRQFQMMQRAAEAEGAAQFVQMLESGVDPTTAVNEFNKHGISKIKPDSFQFDPETGAVSYEEEDGTRYEGSLSEMRQLVDVYLPKQGESYTLKPGETRFQDGKPVAHVPAEAGGTSQLPADAQMVEYLVANQIVADKGEAYALVRQSRANPAEAAMKYVQLAMKAQEDAGLYPGEDGYKTLEQLQQEAMQWIQQVNEDQAKQFRSGRGGGGLDDAERGGLPGNLGRHAEALGSAGPTRARAAAQEQGQARTGNGPYPEGTRLRGQDGRVYVVRNGEPVPADEAG